MASDLLVFFTAFSIANFIAVQLTTIYLHRAMTHGAVTFPGWFLAVAKFLIWTHTSIVPKRWVGVHRHHHANADEEGDPHSPWIFGFWKVQFWNVILYTRATQDEEMVERHTRDIPYTNLDHLLFKRGKLGVLLGGATYFFALGMPGLLGFVVSGLSYAFIQSATINGLGHYPSVIAQRNYDEDHAQQSQNLRFPGKLQWLLTWYLGGEENHNNHHYAPGSAYFAHFPEKGELDLGGMIIRGLARLGVATKVHAQF